MSLTFVEQVHELRLLSVSASHISMQFVDISCAVSAWKIKRSSSIVKAPPAALLLTFQQVYIPWSPSLPYYLMHCRIAALLYQDYIANSHNASNYKTAPYSIHDLWFYQQWLDFVQELVSILGATLLGSKRSFHRIPQACHLLWLRGPNQNLLNSETSSLLWHTPLGHTIGHTMVTRHVTRCHKIQFWITLKECRNINIFNMSLAGSFHARFCWVSLNQPDSLSSSPSSSSEDMSWKILNLRISVPLLRF